MNQAKKLLEHLEENGSATGLEIINLGIMNYKGRIHDLREMGYTIQTVMEEGQNRLGEPCRFARYHLVKSHE